MLTLCYNEHLGKTPLRTGWMAERTMQRWQVEGLRRNCSSCVQPCLILSHNVQVPLEINRTLVCILSSACDGFSCDVFIRIIDVLIGHISMKTIADAFIRICDMAWHPEGKFPFRCAFFEDFDGKLKIRRWFQKTVFTNRKNQIVIP